MAVRGRRVHGETGGVFSQGAALVASTTSNSGLPTEQVFRPRLGGAAKRYRALDGSDAPAWRPLCPGIHRRAGPMLGHGPRPSGTGRSLCRAALVDRAVVQSPGRSVVAGVELSRPHRRADRAEGVRPAAIHLASGERVILVGAHLPPAPYRHDGGTPHSLGPPSKWDTSNRCPDASLVRRSLRPGVSTRLERGRQPISRS
jgi:hypothetical protein